MVIHLSSLPGEDKIKVRHSRTCLAFSHMCSRSIWDITEQGDVLLADSGVWRLAARQPTGMKDKDSNRRQSSIQHTQVIESGALSCIQGPNN